MSTDTDDYPKSRNYTNTDYPGIYKVSYWGNFDYDSANMNIILNRNRFIEENDIKQFTKSKKMLEAIYVYAEKLIFKLDHLEIYRKYDKTHILLVSTYSKIDDFLKGFFTETYKLYRNHAYSYFIEFKDYNELKNLFISMASAYELTIKKRV